MNKKGMEISLNFIVIAAIVLIALIVAILFFTGASTKLFTKQQQITSAQLQQEIALQASTCKSYCTFNNKDAYMGQIANEDLRAAGYTTCSRILTSDEDKKNCGSCAVAVVAQQPGISCDGATQSECESPGNGCKWDYW